MTEKKAPATMAEHDTRSDNAWAFSFAAAMLPFTAFCYGHSKGMTGIVLERMVKMPGGFYGIFALPFLTLGMEKCVYDTAQAFQGIDPNVRPADRGGFPSGGADLPSFSLVAVQKTNIVESFFSRQTKTGKDINNNIDASSARNDSLVRKLTQKINLEK